MNRTKVAVVYYSTWGHIRTMAESVAKGASLNDVDVKIYQIPETLPQEVLQKMHAPPKADYPVATADDLIDADAIIFGIPTRFGNASAQVKAFFDATGQLWATGKLVGKLASVFVSTGTQGGGQETTALTAYTNFVHHGMVIVPIGYSDPSLMSLDEVHGGSPYGAGTYSGPDGSRLPSKLELGVAEHQGKLVAQLAADIKKGRSLRSGSSAPQYELIYFNVRARAELVRYIFAETGTAYVDNRVENKEWEAIKPSTPFRQLPILRVGKEMIAQSQAIARYLAREKGLNGSSQFETAVIDSLAESAKDVLDKYFPAFFSEVDKESKLEAFYKNITNYMKVWEDRVLVNGGKYFVGQKISYADLAVFDALTQITSSKEDFLNEYPNLKSFVASVAARPNIANYIKTRPKTEQ